MNWIDAVLLSWNSMPSAVCKADIENVPIIGPMGRQVGCMFFDRDLKGDKRDVVQMTLERQIQAEQGIWPPLIICCEGGTSNGKQLIEFKKGAFAGLRGITPAIIQQTSPFLDMECCVLPMWAHVLL